MEHIISSQVMRHLDTNDHHYDVLHDAQHGFRKRRSCETQLLLSADDFLKTLDKNVQTDAILLDFSKAFDRAAHTHLLKKLEATGVTDTTLGWISSFLNDREQTAVLEGMSSDSKPVTSGVPQGTVLGRYGFWYISMTCRTVWIHQPSDCLLMIVGFTKRSTLSKTPKTSKQTSMQTWERRWLMSFHSQKCQLLWITRKPSPIIAQYNIHGHVLEVADTAKYLGVTLHKHCAWSKHISQTAKKANNTRAFLQRNLRRAPTSVKKRAYETLVRPILEYASAVWDPHAESDIYRLEMVQRRYARYTCNDFGRTSSVTAMLRQIGWDTLQERISHRPQSSRRPCCWLYANP